MWFLCILFSIDDVHFLPVLVHQSISTPFSQHPSLQPRTVSMRSLLSRRFVCCSDSPTPFPSHHTCFISHVWFLCILFSIDVVHFLSVLVCLHAPLVTRPSLAAPVQPRVPPLTSLRSPPREWIENLNANCKKYLCQYNWKRYGNDLDHRFTIFYPLPLLKFQSENITIDFTILFSHVIKKLVRTAHMG